MNVKDRLYLYIISLKIPVSTFEKSIGVSNGYINSITKSVGIEKINVIAEKYANLNIDWLMTGRGNMIREVLSDSTHSKRITDSNINSAEPYSLEELNIKYVRLYEKYASLLENNLEEWLKKKVDHI